jgi:hypothetical protein
MRTPGSPNGISLMRFMALACYFYRGKHNFPARRLSASDRSGTTSFLSILHQERSQILIECSVFEVILNAYTLPLQSQYNHSRCFQKPSSFPQAPRKSHMSPCPSRPTPEMNPSHSLPQAHSDKTISAWEHYSQWPL